MATKQRTVMGPKDGEIKQCPGCERDVRLEPGTHIIPYHDDIPPLRRCCAFSRMTYAEARAKATALWTEKVKLDEAAKVHDAKTLLVLEAAADQYKGVNSYLVDIFDKVRKMGFERDKCPECDGTGRVVAKNRRDPLLIDQVTCPLCLGRKVRS